MAKPRKKKIESPFSKNLQMILSERNIGQKQGASLAGVSISVFNNWLSNTGTPQNLPAVAKLSKALGIDFQWILTGEKSLTSAVEHASLGDLFNIEQDSMFSGIFQIEAKRLTRKKANQTQE